MKQLIRALTTIGAILIATALAAQPGVHVADLVIACWPTDAHRYVETTFAPPNDALTLKFYFRSITSPDFHFVEATTNLQGRAVAILPIAEPQTTSVELFAELVTRSYIAFRTESLIVPAMPSANCANHDPAVSWYQGQNADITVGSTRPGSPLPLGFRPDGISRVVEVTGATAGGGGGGGSRLPYVLAGTGGALAAGAFALGASSDTDTDTDTDSGPPVGGGSTSTTVSAATTSVAGGSTTTVTTTSVGGGGGGPTTTSTTPGPSSTTSTPGSTTTTSTPGSTTSTPGSTTTTPGTTTSTPSSTTSTSTTTTSTPPTTTTTTMTPPSGTDISLSLSSTAPFMSGGSWYFSVNGTVTNHGPGNATNILVTINVAPGLVSIGNNAGCGSGGTLVCVLGNISSGSPPKTFRVDFRADSPGSYTNHGIASLNQSDPNPSNNSTNVTTSVTTLRPGSPLRTEARTTLLPSRGSAEASGRILVNEAASFTVGSGGETSLPLELRPGRNEIIATADTQRGGTWRFDFRGTTGFTRFQVQSGEILAADGYGVTFRLHPGVNEVRFSFDVEGETP